MFFKKKVSLTNAYPLQCDFIFSKDREDGWENLRNECNNEDLKKVKPEEYFKHLRAVSLQLLDITINRTNRSIATDAYFVRDKYLKQNNLIEITLLTDIYSNAFGSSSVDGIKPMVSTFIRNLVGKEPDEKTFNFFYEFFYEVLNDMFDKINKVKLVV